MPALWFRPLFEDPNRCDGISSSGGPVVSSLNVDKEMATPAMNINLNSYMENIKNRTL